MANGVLFGVPIPEQYEAIGGELQTSIEQALQEAEDSGVSRRGKEVTPWLLKRVGELTGGKSLASSESYHLNVFDLHLTLLTSDVALIENTALVGGFTSSFSCFVQVNRISRRSDRSCIC